MRYTTLPNTDIKVSRIWLGNMTYREQNTDDDAHEQAAEARPHHHHATWIVEQFHGVAVVEEVDEQEHDKRQ